MSVGAPERAARADSGGRGRDGASQAPADALAEVLGAAGETLRYYRDLGMAEVTLTEEYFLNQADRLRRQEARLQGCRRCKLCEGRSTIVFGCGNPSAVFVVIGEGPGADEDAQGKPFVGRAGQLLTRMLESVKLDREGDVYIMNVVKCRPPGNRNPEADEIEACAPFFTEQLETLQPSVILTLGSVATQAMLRTREPIGKLRGRVHPFGGAVLIPTFHPAFLLRNPGQEYKRMAWEDLKLARREYDRLRGH
jgi:uracil-DNA glycosylase family 4